jgi:DNA-binding transcriptional regulator YiaG
MRHNVVSNDRRDGLKSVWIGQSAAKHHTVYHDMMKVQRLGRKSVGPSGPKCGANMKRDLKARFFSKVVQRDSGCHEWTGCIMPNGYGQFHKDGQTAYAHRVAFELAYGSLGDAFVLHTCDNRKCVNPAHLLAGDFDANMQDMVVKQRQALGERNAHAKLTKDQVRDIRAAVGTQREIAARYGVTASLVSMIRSGRIWRHV